MLSGQWVSGFSNFVPRSADFHHVSSNWHSHIHPQQICVLRSTLFLLPRRTPSEIGLMLSTLGMSKIGSIVLMHREAEATFEGTNMVLEEIWVFVKVDGLQSQLS